ncbi:hypothetical protein TSOC_014010, partial [Tetrabaena socialis]
LEFARAANPGADGDAMVDLLVLLVAEELAAAFGIRMPLHRTEGQGQQLTQERQQEHQQRQQQQQGQAQAQQQPKQRDEQRQQQQERRQGQQEAQQQREQLEQRQGQQQAMQQAGGCQGRRQEQPDPTAGQLAGHLGGLAPETACGEGRGGGGLAGPGGDGMAAPPGVEDPPAAVATAQAGGVGASSIGSRDAATMTAAGEPPGEHARDSNETSDSGTSGTSGNGSGACLSSSWVWELCSTTAAKFSRHLVLRIPHCAFKNNFHVNAFVQRLFDRIAADPARFASFFVRRSADPSEPPTLFIDPAVYTRNRAFRLYLSSKAGKSAVLRATRRHATAHLLSRLGLADPPTAATAATTTTTVGEGSAADDAEDTAAEEGDPPPLQSEGPIGPAAGGAGAGVAWGGAGPRAARDGCASGSGAPACSTAAAAVGGSCVPGASSSGNGVPTCSNSSSTARAPPAAGSVLLPPQLERQVARALFFATLITLVGRVDRLLLSYKEHDDGGNGAAAATGTAAPLTMVTVAAATASALGSGAAASCSGIPRLPLPGGGGPARTHSLGGGAGGAAGSGGGGGGGWGTGAGTGPRGAMAGPGEAFCYGPSPFPQIEAFVESVCCEVRSRGE